MDSYHHTANVSESSHQRSDELEAHASQELDTDAVITNKVAINSRLMQLRQGVKYYRNLRGVVSVVPWLVHLIAESGFESCIDASRIFETLLEDPKLDPVKVAEKMWAEHRPLVLARLASGPLEPTEDKRNTKPSIGAVAFRFLELPPELRNMIYGHMLKSRRRLHDLTGKTSDWFNPAVLCTSGQIHSEASCAIYRQQITVVIDPIAVACCQPGLHKLPEKSRFKSCCVDIDMSDPRLLEGRTRIRLFSTRDIAQTIFHFLVEDMKMMKCLEELRLLCKRASFFHLRSDQVIWYKTFDDDDMHCFRKLKGLEKISIEGDLHEAYADELLADMKKPPIDLSSSRQRIRVIQRSICDACDDPAENYLQVEDEPCLTLSDVTAFHHVFDRRRCDKRCPKADLPWRDTLPIWDVY